MKILLCADACPQNVSFYYERAMRSMGHSITTLGPLFTEHDLAEWKDSEGANNEFLAIGEDVRFSMLANLKRNRDYVLGGKDPVEISPDIYRGHDLIVWIDSGQLRLHLSGLEKIDIPSIAIIGDTRGRLESQIEHARQFSHVFVQFTPYTVLSFKSSGIQNIAWLPPAADEELHYHNGEVEQIYDIGFIGSTSQWHRRRVDLLQQLYKEFNVMIGAAIHQEMALMYKRCKLIFNCSLDGDINMRVPEAMMSGRALLTDSVVGLEAFGVNSFEYYGHEFLSIVGTVKYLLSRDEGYLQSAAGAARKDILEGHTYKHRVKKILGVL